MKNVVIIGNSAAGFTVASGLRQKGAAATVTVITDEAFPFYDKQRLADFLAGTIKEKDLYLVKEDYYQKNEITFLKEAKVISVNAARKTLSFKEREPLAYDYLVICAGRSYHPADIPGARKTNVFTLSCLTDYKEFVSFLGRSVVESVCLAGHDESAFKAAQALAARGKEVKMVGRCVPCACPSSAADSLAATTAAAPVAGVCGQLECIQGGIAEIIGESEVQAVRLSEGKIIGVQTVVFMDDEKSNRDFLKNTAINQEDDFIVVDECFRTSVPDIFACGSICRQEPCAAPVTWDDSKKQGVQIADTLVQLVGCR